MSWPALLHRAAIKSVSIPYSIALKQKRERVLGTI